MTTAADSVVLVSYRPLATMDELHLLLLAAVSGQGAGVSLLEKVFSLPEKVVVRELGVLEQYGLAQKSDNTWMATSRGGRLIAVWNSLQCQTEVKVQANAGSWLLGPGEFAPDQMIRDQDEIEALARHLGVADAGLAVSFLNERRRVADRFESFVLEWSSQVLGGESQGVFGETLLFDNLPLAETEQALTRLEELLARRIGEVVDRFKETEVADVHANGNGKTEDAAASMRKNGQDVMKKFVDAQRTQHRQNQRLAKLKMTCEAFLAGHWLLTNVGALRETFKTEPAAFVFNSTVPLVEPEPPKKKIPPVRHLPSPATPKLPKHEEEGLLRSVFRWLFG